MNFHDVSIKGLMSFIWFMTGWNCPRDFWMALSISISTSTSISISVSISKSISISISIPVSISIYIYIYISISVSTSLYLNLNTESHTVNPSNKWSMHAGANQIQYTKIIVANEMLYAYVCLCMLMYAYVCWSSCPSSQTNYGCCSVFWALHWISCKLFEWKNLATSAKLAIEVLIS